MKQTLEMALEALEWFTAAEQGIEPPINKTITAIKEALAQPEQKPKCKYRRGDRLICLETEEYCVIHISGTDRQWIKFPDSYVGVYTNEKVAEMFEVLPKEPDQEQENMIFEMEWPEYHYQGMGCGLEDRGITDRYEAMRYGWDEALSHVAKILPEVIYTTPPQRKPLTRAQIINALATTMNFNSRDYDEIIEPITRAIEAAHGIKE